MGEEHLPQLVIQRLFAPARVSVTFRRESPCRDARPVFRGLQGRQGRARRKHVWPGFRGQPVAVAGGAGGRVAEAAGAQDDGIRREPFAVRRTDPGDPAILRFQGADRGVQPDLTPADASAALQGTGHVAGLLRGGKTRRPPLHHHRAAGALQKGHHVLRGEPRQGARRESADSAAPRAGRCPGRSRWSGCSGPCR